MLHSVSVVCIQFRSTGAPCWYRVHCTGSLPYIVGRRAQVIRRGLHRRAQYRVLRSTQRRLSACANAFILSERRRLRQSVYIASRQLFDVIISGHVRVILRAHQHNPYVIFYINVDRCATSNNQLISSLRRALPAPLRSSRAKDNTSEVFSRCKSVTVLRSTLTVCSRVYRASVLPSADRQHTQGGHADITSRRSCAVTALST